jgi:hypothetical protein
MRMDGVARYALLGALAVSLACARNSEETDTGASGDVTATDTGATVRVRPDTSAIVDTSGMMPSADSTGGAGAPVRPTATDSARMTIDTTAPALPADPSAPAVPDTASPAPGWPTDSSQGGWSTPPDSGQ